MLNSGALHGKTIFISGASRGIGKAIALKVAKDGANVVIAAKTADTHSKLPGTIYSAADEIEKAGGQCLPCQVDVREENQVQTAVEAAVKRFGGIDIVINNASAISLSDTLNTPMKRYDLMNSVNTRGTYMLTQKCIPYLKQSKHAHVLNISPPLNMKPIWFKNHVAYTMAKYGMSMCVLGMSAELKKDNIAVNALWPRTAIWTAAMDMIGGKDVSKQCRTDQIMSDAAYVILTKDPNNYTGNFAIDEDVLKEVGVTDFNKYAVEPGHPLMPDFFLDEAEPFLSQFYGEDGPDAAASEKSSTSSSSPGAVLNIFDVLKSFVNQSLVEQTNASYEFNLSGSEPGTWFIDLKNGDGNLGSGNSPVDVDVTFTMDSDNFIKMFKGELKPTAAFMSGKMKMKGDLQAAMKLEKLMGQMKSKL